MKGRAWAALAASLLPALAEPAHAKTLEELIEGRFTAIGTNRIKPGQPAERIFCRFTGSRIDSHRMSLAGRCATVDQSTRVTMDFNVQTPGRRYGMRIEMEMKALHGYERAYRYDGIATDSALTFTAPFWLDGKAYRSTFRVSIRSGAIERIMEIVTAQDGGEETTLLDLRVSRE